MELSVPQTRRTFTALLGTSLVAAPAVLRPAQAAGFGGFTEAIWSEARGKGVSRATFEAAFASVSPDPKVIELSNRQPEFKDTIADYVDRRVSLKRVTNGRAAFAEWRSTLDDIAARSGVPAHIVCSIWGMETAYGTARGDHYVIRALATLAYQGRRAAFFRSELLEALQILQAGDVKPARMLGSWAGAMGHTQFMPSSFRRFAVDYDRDGRRDVWDSIPDALGSAANYLRLAKWQAGVPWGYEVVLPGSMSASQYPRSQRRSLSSWASLGLRRPNGAAISGEAEAALWQPMQGAGPVLLITSNFGVIKRYNNADSYALAVGHLGDRIRGERGFSVPWPANETGLMQADREEIQRLLNQRGYDLGEPDGLIGDKTKAAIRQMQQRLNMDPTGEPSPAFLNRLRRG